MTAGKGSTPRPYSVPKETFDEAFERIFKNKEPAKPGSSLLGSMENRVGIE